MKRIARISTAAFLAGVTTLAVSLPMPAASSSNGAAATTAQRIAELPVRVEPDSSDRG